MLFVPKLAPPPRRIKVRLPAVAPPTGPTLVMAAFNEDGYVQLRFDVPVDVDAFVGASLRVNDDDQSGLRWVGLDGPEQIDNYTVLVTLDSDGPSTGPGQQLSVSGGNGIVAAETGAAWGGADLALPFG